MDANAASGTRPDSPTSTPLPRTPEQIIERIEQVKDHDFLGTIQSDLIRALPFEQARPFLVPDATAERWQPTDTVEQVREAAIDYLGFAVEKATGHRGISASRSVDHYDAWLWLLDLLPEDWDSDRENGWAQYGVPLLRSAAAALGVELPADDPETARMLERMGGGLPCEPGCAEGCG